MSPINIEYDWQSREHMNSTIHMLRHFYTDIDQAIGSLQFINGMLDEVATIVKMYDAYVVKKTSGFKHRLHDNICRMLIAINYFIPFEQKYISEYTRNRPPDDTVIIQLDGFFYVHNVIWNPIVR